MKKIMWNLLWVLMIFSCSGAVLAATTESSSAKGIDDFIAYFIAMGLAAAVGAVAQSFVISKALDGISRNPNAHQKLFTPMVLGLALIESLIIFTFVSVFMVQ